MRASRWHNQETRLAFRPCHTTQEWNTPSSSPIFIDNTFFIFFKPLSVDGNEYQLCLNPHGMWERFILNTPWKGPLSMAPSRTRYSWLGTALVYRSSLTLSQSYGSWLRGPKALRDALTFGGPLEAIAFLVSGLGMEWSSQHIGPNSASSLFRTPGGESIGGQVSEAESLQRKRWRSNRTG